MTRTMAGCLAMGLLAGCIGHVDDRSRDGAGTGALGAGGGVDRIDAGSGGAVGAVDAGSDGPVGAADSGSSLVPPATCALAAEGVVPTPTEADVVKLLLGRWLLCKAPSVFGTYEEIGLEITADGRWYKLYPDPNGEPTRGLGWDKRGSWTVVDISGESNGPGMFQLNLDIDGGLTIITYPPVFATSPRKMQLNTMAPVVADYVLE